MEYSDKTILLLVLYVQATTLFKVVHPQYFSPNSVLSASTCALVFVIFWAVIDPLFRGVRLMETTSLLMLVFCLPQLGCILDAFSVRMNRRSLCLCLRRFL